jgi:hypothetical protein
MRQGDAIDGLDIGDLGPLNPLTLGYPSWLVTVETQFPTHGSRVGSFANLIR